MKIAIPLIICSLLLNCENNSDKTQDKIRKLLQDYAYARLVGGARNILGDPICGGDPIGYMLGWNWDVPVPINLEIGQTYQFEGNPNAITTASNYKESHFNFFRVLNSDNTKNTIYRVTLLNDCSNSVVVLGGSRCIGTNYTTYVDSGRITCVVSNANEYNNLEKQDSYEECIANKELQHYFIRISMSECEYSITVNYR